MSFSSALEDLLKQGYALGPAGNSFRLVPPHGEHKMKQIYEEEFKKAIADHAEEKPKMKPEERSRQGIRITTEEYVSHGKEYVKIKTIRALKAKSLPEEYFKGTGNAVYLSEGGLRLFYKEEVAHYSELLIVGQVYIKRYFNTAMEYIKIAGIRLGTINKIRKEDPVIKEKEYAI